MPPIALTFGCRLNAAESRVMISRVREAGLGDAILVNTCAVTARPCARLSTPRGYPSPPAIIFWKNGTSAAIAASRSALERKAGRSVARAT